LVRPGRALEIIKEYRCVDELARNVADMPTYLKDRLMAWDLAKMERDGFTEIVRLRRPSGVHPGTSSVSGTPSHS
jgi:hypothetical protein